VTGCRPKPTPDPTVTFKQISSDSLHGNLQVAYEKADEARQSYATSDADWSLRFRLLEAEVLIYQGRRSEAIGLLEAPGISYPTIGDNAIKRNVLCALGHATLGQGGQADQELSEAQRLADASHSKLIGEVLRTEAVIQDYRGNWNVAEELSRKSLKTARHQHDSFLEANDLSNLGHDELKLEHYDEAIDLLNEAVDVAKSIQARVLMQLALGNLGVAYASLGDYEKALANFQQAQQEAKLIGSKRYQIDWLWSAGAAYYRLGNLQASSTDYEEALKDALAINAPTQIAGIHTQLAFLLYQQGQFDAAKSHTEDAIRAAHIAGDRGAELDPMFVQALVAARQNNGQDAERMLMQVYTESAEIPSLRGAIENALANYFESKKQTRQTDFWYRKSIRTFEDQRAAVKEEELRLPFFANGDALYRDYADFLIASQKQGTALQLLDFARARTLSEGLDSANQPRDAQPEKAVDEQAVARKLNSVILFYALGPEKSWMWVITPHRTHLFALPGKSKIEVQVKRYQNAIAKSSDPLRDANPSAEMLYDTLVGPAVSMIPKGSKVLIVPDGILSGLNFETLLTSEPGKTHYWIEDVTIRNATSIRMLSRLDPSPPKGEQKKLLLIGNPIASGTGYDSLVNAFAEIRGIAKHFPQPGETIVTQSGAVPAAYARSKPDGFSYIHFVAHGTASRLDPLDSAVVLSPPPDDPENFKLYARDIMRYPLHARLVTISACYGSGLRAYAGEGLVGLSWAFLRAGAHNVIGALWEVNDASTPLLMDRLYGELADGNSPDDALRAAKLSLIHSQGVYRKPLYWGAFQLYTGS
jgi:CHAT domain-containing protein/tetratricopeptide (TPR) repeat protein